MRTTLIIVVLALDFTSGDAGQKEKIITPRKEFTFKTAEREPKSRTFHFTYAATVKDLAPGKEVSIWVPLPSDSPEQTVSIVSKNLPGQEQIAKEKQYGNRILHVKAKANDQGKVPLEIVFKVTRKEVRTEGDPSLFLKPLAQERIKRFLEPDSMVPVGGKGLTLIENK